MPKKNPLLEALKSLTPAERKELGRTLLGEDAKPKAEKHGPEAAKAGKVFFFKQINRYAVFEEEKKADTIIKKATVLPPRVIAVDERQAWRLFWKQGNTFQFLGSSDGTVWRRERNAGKTVSEAQAAEYEAMIVNPDLSPPMNREKTFFMGTKPSTVARGNEIGWGEGLKQLSKS